MKAPRSLQARLSLSIGGLLVFLWLAAATVTGAVLRHVGAHDAVGVDYRADPGGRGAQHRQPFLDRAHPRLC